MLALKVGFYDAPGGGGSVENWSVAMETPMDIGCNCCFNFNFKLRLQFNSIPFHFLEACFHFSILTNFSLFSRFGFRPGAQEVLILRVRAPMLHVHLRVLFEYSFFGGKNGKVILIGIHFIFALLSIDMLWLCSNVQDVPVLANHVLVAV